LLPSPRYVSAGEYLPTHLLADASLRWAARAQPLALNHTPLLPMLPSAIACCLFSFLLPCLSGAAYAAYLKPACRTTYLFCVADAAPYLPYGAAPVYTGRGMRLGTRLNMPNGAFSDA